MKNLDKIALTKLVGGGVVLLVLVVGYLLVLSPRMSEVDEIKAQTESTRQSNQVVATTIADLEQKEAGLDDRRRVAAALAERFPSSVRQAAMFADIRDAAARAGIADEDVTALTPTVPVAVGSLGADGSVTLPQTDAAPVTGLATMEVAATVTGTRAQLRSFLAAMEDQERSYLFDTAGLSAATADGSTDGAGAGAGAGYTLTVAGSMFLLPEVPDPDAAVAPAPADPAAVPPAGSAAAQ